MESGAFGKKGTFRLAFSLRVPLVVAGLRVADGVLHSGLGPARRFADPGTAGGKRHREKHGENQNCPNLFHIFLPSFVRPTHGSERPIGRRVQE